MKGTQGNTKEYNCAASRCQPHENYVFFLNQGKTRDIGNVLVSAHPNEAARMKVSPEHHFARLLKTADNALQDGKTWNLPVVFEDWYDRYADELEPLTPPKSRETRLLEFLAAHSEMKLGYGESPLSRAGAQARKGIPPKELNGIKSENLKVMACFCRELARQDDRGKMRFFLSSRAAAAIVNSEDAMVGHRLMGALVAVKVLKVTQKGIQGESGKATRYKYIASDANEGDTDE